MADVKKLSHLNSTMTSAKVKPQFNVIVENLDKIFTLQNDTVLNVCQFFHGFNVEDVLLEEQHLNVEQRKRLVDLIKSEIKNYEKTQKQPGKCLLLHLTDYEYLADYVIAIVKKSMPEFNYSRTVVKNFIKSSPEFNQALTNLQNRFIKEFIANTTVTDPFCERNIRHRCFVSFDEIFRNKVIFCLKILGLKRPNIELSLEQNADLWRKQNMVRSFDEYYYPQIDEPTDSYLYLKWCELHKMHREEWLKYYEFNYANKYSAVIEKAGTFTDNMKISQFRFFDSIKKTTEYNNQRFALLKQSQANRQENKNESEVVKGNI